MSRSHRGRKGDGWPRRPPALPAAPAVAATAIRAARAPAALPDVCPQGARCGHVVCSIVWYCMEVSGG